MARIHPTRQQLQASCALHALVRLVRRPSERDVDPAAEVSTAVVVAEVEQVLLDRTGTVRRGSQIQFRIRFRATEGEPTLGGDDELLLAYWRAATHAEVFLTAGAPGAGVWEELECYPRRVAPDKSAKSDAWRQRKAAPRHPKRRSGDTDDDADIP